jgi:hypothetical protein
LRKVIDCCHKNIKIESSKIYQISIMEYFQKIKKAGFILNIPTIKKLVTLRKSLFNRQNFKLARHPGQR